jgi:ceramide glucosyltransferase
MPAASARRAARISVDDESNRRKRRRERGRPVTLGKRTVTSVARSVLPWVGFTLAAFAMAYGLIACIAVRRRTRNLRPAPSDLPPVTILKPLCGAEPETYECLRSFCDQAYAEFQVVFGVCDANDPVLGIVGRLRREFPQRDLQVVVDRRQHGSSRKVSNLINMMAVARHEFLVLSDSDVRVNRDYLARIVAPLLEGGVGIVTCAYRGCPDRGLWSLLGSSFINEWFIPSVRVAAMAGSRSFAFGATIAMRRQVLARIGGFGAIADQLADDYRLGELTRRLGLRTVLSEVVVDVRVAERSFGDLVRHELRWLRTIRALRPAGYAFSFITFGVPVAAFGALLAGGAAPVLGLLAATAAARVMLHVSTREPGSAATQLVVLPLRDLLTSSLWAWSFTARSVHWREGRFRVTRDGSVQPVSRI